MLGFFKKKLKAEQVENFGWDNSLTANEQIDYFISVDGNPMGINEINDFEDSTQMVLSEIAGSEEAHPRLLTDLVFQLSSIIDAMDSSSTKSVPRATKKAAKILVQNLQKQLKWAQTLFGEQAV
jgi:hypothetical protein